MTRTQNICLVGLIAVLGCSLNGGQQALANAAPSSDFIYGQVAGNPELGKAGPIQIPAEDLRLNCVPARCSFVATYEVVNPAGEQHELSGLFLGPVRRAELDGQPIKLRARPKLEGRRPSGLKSFPDGAVPMSCELDNSGAPKSFRQQIPPESRAELSFRGQLTGAKIWEAARMGAYLAPYAQMRAPLLYSALLQDYDAVEFCYHLWPIQGWEGQTTINLSVITPAEDERTWDVVHVQRDGERVELAASPASEQRQSFRAQLASPNLGLLVATAAKPSRDSYAVVAVGGELAYGVGLSRPHFARLGLNVSALNLLNLGLGWEGDVQGRPYAELTVGSPMLVIIPGFFVGFGASRIDRAVSPRYVAGMSWLFFTVQHGLDADSGERFWLFSLNI